MSDCKITVRTRDFGVFQPFFRSFFIFHEARLSDLIIYLDSETDDLHRYEKLVAAYPMVSLTVLDRHEVFPEYNGNYYAYSLYRSLNHDRVVTFDDDVLFVGKGLFEKVSALLERHKIASERLISRQNKTSVASYFIAKRDLDFTRNDFGGTTWDREPYDGNDAYRIYANYGEDCGFVNDHIPFAQDTGNSRSFSKNEFYIHISSGTYAFRDTNRNI